MTERAGSTTEHAAGQTIGAAADQLDGGGETASGRSARRTAGLAALRRDGRVSGRTDSKMNARAGEPDLEDTESAAVHADGQDGQPEGRIGSRNDRRIDGGTSPIPHPRGTNGIPVTPSRGTPFRLLVIESDVSDAVLIEQLVADSGAAIEIHWAHGIDQAAALLSPTLPAARRSRPRGSDFSCVLLDLAAPGELPALPDSSGVSGPPGPHSRPGLLSRPDGSGRPDANDGTEGLDSPDGLDGLRELLRRAPHTAVVVLTDAGSAELGAAAVAAGAQDFLVKHETDGPLLARALRYAVERKRADESQRRLVEAELRGQENARLQRHLLPTPLLDGAGLAFTRRYRPGRRRALLGGDFYDAVRTGDGTVHVVIGDVCGHGPDEAALGVALRIAWRTLVFAGLTGEKLLSTLQHVLEHERRSDEIFATLCMLVLSPEPTAPTPSASPAPHAPAAPASAGAVEHAQLYLAGHPAPLLLRPEGRPVLLPSDQAGPALGLVPCDDGQAVWPAQHLELQPGWRLMLYTDGLVEGRVGAGSPRLGQDGLVELIGDHQSTGLTRGRLVDSAIAEVEELNGGSLTDDVAVLLLERNPAPVIMG
ncbi:SpoIIE family protein phosphatase [Kitasatospora sp. GP82]|uniref:PP2C family protein-serine/threonine phosphatase n=1 Tax=Kitasatospora sp. GP82 TaxID=3035089 RepID=UPI002473B8D5|nr:SpoIIE family protein phosphatase [Kitasatospora sp. GP82]